MVAQHDHDHDGDRESKKAVCYTVRSLRAFLKDRYFSRWKQLFKRAREWDRTAHDAAPDMRQCSPGSRSGLNSGSSSPKSASKLKFQTPRSRSASASPSSPLASRVPCASSFRSSTRNKTNVAAGSRGGSAMNASSAIVASNGKGQARNQEPDNFQTPFSAKPPRPAPISDASTSPRKSSARKSHRLRRKQSWNHTTTGVTHLQSVVPPAGRPSSHNKESISVNKQNFSALASFSSNLPGSYNSNPIDLAETTFLKQNEASSGRDQFLYELREFQTEVRANFQSPLVRKRPLKGKLPPDCSPALMLTGPVIPSPAVVNSSFSATRGRKDSFLDSERLLLGAGCERAAAENGEGDGFQRWRVGVASLILEKIYQARLEKIHKFSAKQDQGRNSSS
ncbi:unnamed protein product [Amoebophrya sp. A120]|nr:unnamed protein product [Amoebophrya sp. A120]|eukprot:GSA120T00005361001.1